MLEEKGKVFEERRHYILFPSDCWTLKLGSLSDKSLMTNKRQESVQSVHAVVVRALAAGSTQSAE